MAKDFAAPRRGLLQARAQLPWPRGSAAALAWGSAPSSGRGPSHAAAAPGGNLPLRFFTRKLHIWELKLPCHFLFFLPPPSPPPEVVLRIRDGKE